MSKRKQPTPITTYTPRWKGAIEGYVVNYITRHYWKVEATQERGDLIQEAWIVFDRCAKKYPDMDTPQHFMALFKRAWSNHFTDLAKLDTQHRTTLSMFEEADEEQRNGLAHKFRELVGETDNEGSLAVRIAQAPPEITLILKLFISAPQELVDLAFDAWEPHSRRANQGSARINKLLGFPTAFDSMGAVRSYLLQ